MNSLPPILLEVGISSIVAILVSLATTAIINTKLYRVFNRGKLQEELRMNGSPQISVYNVSTRTELSNLTEEKRSCANYSLDQISVQKAQKKGNTQSGDEMEQTKSGRTIFRITQLTDLNKLDTNAKWKYLYITNLSQIDVLLSRIKFETGFEKNLYDWNSHRMRPQRRLGVFINRKDEPREIVLDFNGWELKYEITDREGSLTYDLKRAHYKNSKNVKRRKEL